MKRMLKFQMPVVVLATMVVLLMILSACSKGNKEAETTKVSETTSTATTSTATEEPAATTAPLEPKTLKVAFFKGGYGDSWFLELKKQFEVLHPNVTVELEGDPAIGDKITPRIESGANLPDVAYLLNTTWQKWADQGYLADLTDLYEGDSMDAGIKFKDTMNSAALAYSSYKGKNVIVPWSDGVLGMAYNAGMFEENGWEVPKTWAEFDVLAEKIKAKGIAVLTFPGKNAPSYLGFMITPLMVQAGGIENFNKMLTMDSPDVLNDPVKLLAFQKLEDLIKSGMILKGSEALTHTESQIEFLKGKVAMIPNGNWLEGEMKDTTPAGFRMKMMQVPAIDNAVEPNVYYSLIGDMTIIPAKAKEIELAKEFIKFASSVAMNKKFTELVGGFRPFKYDLDGIKVSEFTKSVMDIMQNNKGFLANSLSPMSTKMGLYPSGDPYAKIPFGKKTAKQQFDDDYKFAKDKWEKNKAELGIK
jgi:N-acetylglucosamine transport system substrate-binding protein